MSALDIEHGIDLVLKIENPLETDELFITTLYTCEGMLCIDLFLPVYTHTKKKFNSFLGNEAHIIARKKPRALRFDNT